MGEKLKRFSIGNSMFFKIMCMLTAFSIVSFFIFGMFVANITSLNMVERNKETQLNLVRQATNSADIIIKNICSTMNYTLFSKNIIPTVIAPTLRDYDKDILFTKQLNDIAGSNDSILEAAVYIASSNVVICSNSEIVPVESYRNQQVLKDFLNNSAKKHISYEEEKNFFLQDNAGRLFLLETFPKTGENPVAVIIFELDARLLLESVISQKNDSNISMGVYYPNGNPVPSLNAGATVFPADMLSDSYGNFIYEGKTNFYCASAIADWFFVYSVDSSSLTPSGISYNGALAPFGAFFFVFCFLFSLCSATFIYKPVRKLLQSINVDATNSAQAKGQSELDFFNMAFNEVSAKKATYQDMLANIAPTVLERVVIDCIKGDELSADKISTRLNSIPTPFKAEDRYVVLATSFKNCSGKETVERDFYTISAQRAIETVLNNKVDYITIAVDYNHLATVVRFGSEASTIQIKATLKKLLEKISTQFSQLSLYGVEIFAGRIYNHITDIQYSYKCALEELEQAENIEDVTSKPEEELAESFDELYFTRRIGHILQKIDDQEFLTAQELCSRMLKELSQRGVDLTQGKKVAAQLSEKLTGKLLLFRASINDPIVTTLPTIDSELSYCNNIEELCGFTNLYCGEIILLFESYSLKVKHKHIINAKEYIHENYSDNAISLSSVSEHINLHPTYLSRLFKKNLGVSFVEYVTEYRLEQAKKMLIESELSIKDIAQKTGFQSMSTFFRVFKKQEELSPGDYRENKKK